MPHPEYPRTVTRYEFVLRTPGGFEIPKGWRKHKKQAIKFLKFLQEFYDHPTIGYIHVYLITSDEHARYINL